MRDLRGGSGEVVISGAGPAGLLAARSILDRRPEATLAILEKRGTSVFSPQRAKPLARAVVCF